MSAGPAKLSGIRKVSSLFTQQLNLTFFGLLLILLLLTKDYTPLLLWAIVEIWYFTVRLNDKSAVDAAPPIQPANQTLQWGGLKWQALASWLLLVCGILFMVVVHFDRIVIFGHRVETPYERWEVAALLWSVAFTALSYGLLPLVNKLVPVLFAICGFFAWGAFVELAKSDYLWHIIFVLGVAFTYLAVDIIMLFTQGSERERFMQTALLADLPTLAALVVLLVYTTESRNREHMSVYLSGAISFQLIASSLVLALIEGGACAALSQCRWLQVDKTNGAMSVAVGGP